MKSLIQIDSIEQIELNNDNQYIIINGEEYKNILSITPKDSESDIIYKYDVKQIIYNNALFSNKPHFLSFNGIDKIKITIYDETDIKDIEYTFFSLLKTNNITETGFYKISKKNDITYIYNFRYMDNNIAFIINEAITKKSLHKYINIGILNEEKIYLINNKDIYDIFKFISPICKDLDELNKFISIYELLQYDINDYLLDKTNYYKLLDYYKKNGLYDYYKYIVQICNPLYENKEIKIYMESKYITSMHRYLLMHKENNIIELISLINKEKEKNKYDRIFESLANYKYNKGSFDPYSGRHLYYELAYETANYKCYKFNGTLIPKSKYIFFTLLDDIYVEANKEEIEQYENDIKLINTLQGDD